MLPIKTGIILLALLVNLSFDSYAQTAIDPTRPAISLVKTQQVTTSVSVAEKLTLQSIMKSGSQFYVVINDQILHRGDLISGVKIQTISSNQVTLSDGRVLRLFTAITNK